MLDKEIEEKLYSGLSCYKLNAGVSKQIIDYIGGEIKEIKLSPCSKYGDGKMMKTIKELLEQGKEEVALRGYFVMALLDPIVFYVTTTSVGEKNYYELYHKIGVDPHSVVREISEDRDRELDWQIESVFYRIKEKINDYEERKETSLIGQADTYYGSAFKNYLLELKKNSKCIKPIILYIEGMGAVQRDTPLSEEMKALEEDIEQVMLAVYDNPRDFIAGYTKSEKRALSATAMSFSILLYKKSDKLRDLLIQQIELSGFEFLEDLFSRVYEQNKIEKVNQLLDEAKMPYSLKITYYVEQTLKGNLSSYYDKLFAIYNKDPDSMLKAYQTLKKEKKGGVYVVFAFLRKMGVGFSSEEICELEKLLEGDIKNGKNHYENDSIMLYEVSQLARMYIKERIEDDTWLPVLRTIQTAAELLYRERKDTLLDNLLEEIAKEMGIKLILKRALEGRDKLPVERVRAFAREHLEEAEELVKEKLVEGDSSITEYIEILFTEDIGMKAETLVSVFNHRLKTVIHFMERFVAEREDQVRGEIEKLKGINNKNMQEAFERLETKWDSKKHAKAIEALMTTQEVASYIQTIYKPQNEELIPYLDEMEGAINIKDREGNELPLILLKFYLSEYMLIKEVKLLEACEAVKRFIDKKQLRLFINELYEKWLQEGAEVKKKNVVLLYVLNASNTELIALKKQIDEWVENSRGALAAFAVSTMVLNDSSMALVMIDSMATKYKNKQVKGAAIEAMDYVAKIWGLSKEVLADKIIPTLGFDEKREIRLSYGTRCFKAKLTPKMEIILLDEEGQKVIKALPKPGAKDDQEKALAAKQTFMGLKKELKMVITNQQQRLYGALLMGRSWQQESWREVFVQNPIMNNFAISLIWGEYDEKGTLLGTFRYMEDGSFNTVEEEAYYLSEGTYIRLVHPMDLVAEVKVAWKKQLSDYEIVQSVEQLDMPIYSLSPEDTDEMTFSRFSGEEVYFGKVLGVMSKYDWQKTSPLDGGSYEGFYYEDEVFGIGMLLRLDSPYMEMDPRATVNSDELLFYKKGCVNLKGYYEGQILKNNLIPLKDVPAKILNLGLMVIHLIHAQKE